MTKTILQHLGLWLLPLCFCLYEAAAQAVPWDPVRVEKSSDRYYRDSIQCLIFANGAISLNCFFSYPIGSSHIQPDFADNATELNKLHRFLRYALEDSLVCVGQVSIKGCGSVDGSFEVNQRIAHTRAYSFLNYMNRKYDLSERYRVDVRAIPVDWDGLRELVVATRYPWRDSVVSVIDTYADLNKRKVELGKLGGGAPYQLLYSDFYPRLRRVEVKITYDMQCMERKLTIAGLPRPGNPAKFTLPSIRRMGPVVAAEPAMIALPRLELPERPLFALKTNLLFDAATLINLEVEVPIGKRLSIAGEVIFPWWLWEERQHCLQVVNGNLEARYWLGNRRKRRDGSPRPLMTGWYAGVYAGGGYYDLEWDKRGYQGEFFIMGGVSGGYAHPIGRHLRMEYSVGVGYLKTNYRYYEARRNPCNLWNLYRQNDGRFSWLGPTRAKISLVWMLHTHRERKGGAR